MTLIKCHNEPGTPIIIIRPYGRVELVVRSARTKHHSPGAHDAHQLAPSLNLYITLSPEERFENFSLLKFLKVCEGDKRHVQQSFSRAARGLAGTRRAGGLQVGTFARMRIF